MSWNTKVCHCSDVLKPKSVLTFVRQEPQRKVNSFDFSEPTFGRSPVTTRPQIVLEIVEPTTRSSVDVEHRATKLFRHRRRAK
jgi:hypothetical protein